TIRVCDLPDYRPFGYVCITPSEQQTLDRLLAANHGPGGVRLFHDRNARSSGLRRQADPQVLLVPSAGLLEMLQKPWERPFAERFPDRHGIVMVSAPIYP